MLLLLLKQCLLVLTLFLLALRRDLDHLVQLVGYGTDPHSGDYWLVRNSWTTLWGDAGYIKLARSANASCGVDVTPLDGNGCKVHT